MKHYELKTEVAGAGGRKGKKPKPATLKPPKLGDYKVASSYTYAEILDLVSDGPIEGLVNKNGYTLPYNALLQGVYLNNVPVEETNENFLTEAGIKTPLLDQSKFSSGIKEMFDDIQFSTRDEIEDKGLLYPDTDNFADAKEVYYSFNTGLYKGNQFINKVEDLSSLINFPADIRNPEKYPVVTYGDTYVSGKSDNTPIRGSFFSDNKYEANFSMGIKHINDVFQEGTNAKKGLDEFLESVYSDNLYIGEYAKGKLRSFGYTEEDIDNGVGEQNIKNLFANIFSKQIPDWYLNSNDFITPYVCITVDGVMEGYEFYNHVNYFLEKDESGSVTSKLNYYADFDLDSESRSEGLNLSSNTLSMFIPNLAENGTWDGKVQGFYFFLLDAESVVYENIEKVSGPSDFDALTMGIDQSELSFLRSLKGFILSDNNPLNNEKAPKKIIPYYELYSFERKLVDTGGCVFTTELNRVSLDKGYSDQDSIESISEDKYQSDVIRKGVQVKWSFKYQTYRERFMEIPIDIWCKKVSGITTDIHYKARVFLDGELVLTEEKTNWNTNGTDNPELSVRIPPSQFLQTITLDIVAYSSLETPTSCPFSLPVIPEVRARVFRPDIFRELEDDIEAQDVGAVKYNWSNVLAEFRPGSRNQAPLTYFKDVNVDYNYQYTLLGPFNPDKNDGTTVQRIVQGDGKLKKPDKYPILNMASTFVPTMDEEYLSAIQEGSSDKRWTGAYKTISSSGGGLKIRIKNPDDFAGWDVNGQDYSEEAQPLTHIIENPNVTSVWFTLNIDALKDTVHRSIGDPAEPDVDAGSSLPANVNIRVETGLIDYNGKTTTTYSKLFQITALVESPSLLDIGNSDNQGLQSYFDYINVYNDINEVDQNNNPIDRGGMFSPFLLDDPKSQTGDPDLNTKNQEHTSTKRFIRVTKLTTETSSTLIFKEVGVVKFSEIIPGQCQYPYSAYCGIKIDSRVFADIPSRSYEAKLKKVKIPSNYFPTFRNGKDKRYYDKANSYSVASGEDRHIYKGDWDGTFKFAWTDNPAWILYDVILNDRYGLGGFVEASSVNKWDLYKIGRFCDAVDEQGYFVGLDDGRGGLEPRFSCNIMFSEETKVFDAINTIATIFRGVVYYNNSTIEFSDDRPKEPIALFTNSNVKEGIFTYSNYQRDEQINTIEVVYIDRYDGYKTKLELVENQADIAERGIFKKSINAFGITSKAMARRAGDHFLYQTTKENQSVAFNCGLETLLCKPGDLIVVDDELKSFKSNFGKVLDVNNNEKSVRISQSFLPNDYDAQITLYKPSKLNDVDSIDDSISFYRSRLDTFTILGNNTDLLAGSGWNNMIGEWQFSGYTSGYQEVKDAVGNYISPLQEEYALYKNIEPTSSGYSPTLWFNTEAQGWVFSTGNYSNSGALENNNLFILEPNLFSFLDLQLFDPNDLTKTRIKKYEPINQDKRGATIGNFTGDFIYNDPSVDLVYYNGNQSTESTIGSSVQIFSVPITGWGSSEYGDDVFVDKDDINSSLLEFVPIGTTYRFTIKDEKDSIYKVTSIKEEGRSEFSIIATKFDTGKYDLIDKGGAF